MKEEINFLRRNNLKSFVRACYETLHDSSEPYEYNWHIGCISEYLTACKNKEITRLNINIPPRHLKSLIGSISFPAWLIGLKPSTKIIAMSNIASNTVKFHNNMRSIIRQKWYKDTFPEVIIDPKKEDFGGDDIILDTRDTARVISTTQGGYRLSASISSSVTGEGAEFIILDDVMSADNISSVAYKNEIVRTIKGSLFSRFNNPRQGVLINISQRLCEDDVVGQICQGEEWTHLILPIEFKEKKFYHFGNFKKVCQEGELLSPKRLDKEYIEQQKRESGSVVFQSQYMQDPAPADGNIFKMAWWQYYNSNIPQEYDNIYISVDCASKDLTNSDYSVFTIWGIKGLHYYLIDLFRKKLNYPDLKKMSHSLGNLHKTATFLIEDASNGIALIQDLKREIHNPVLPIKTGGKSKIIRADTITSIIQSGKVFLPDPKNVSWMDDFLDEINKFPNGKHDDQVDSMSQFLNFIKHKQTTRQIKMIDFN
jgi:predicted phage terminase large subunit-like protein